MAMMTRTTLLLFLLWTPGIEATEVYKWTDEAGQVHYGGNPAGEKSGNIIIHKHKAPSRSAIADEKQHLENIKKWTAARQEERENEKLRKAELEEKKAERTRRCSKLKNSLSDMQRRGRWYRLDEAGNRQYYSDEELEARLKEKTQVIKKHCS